MAARNDPRLRKWFRQVGLINNVEHSDWLKWQAADPNTRMYIAVGDKRTRIGVCGLTSIDHLNRRAEVSLYINPALHRKGGGTKVLKTLVRHGFDDLNLNLIWAEVFIGNPAHRLLTKVGFSSGGTRRDFYYKGGKYLDAHFYSIKRDECSWWK